ncbi:MAG: arginase family protein [Actinomycetota bacterium]|nr:arginase family protein [Actinomycetota bacterium]
MSRLRARCPVCRTLTAVAVGPEYQCHTCGREFCAGLVRVPRAWGKGGESMAAAAHMDLPYPEAGVIEADTLAEQNLLLASELPARPVVLGGCCCSHVGAIEALTAGEECLAVVWIDAHGDLNTPASSPSGNAWGMPLRMVIDDGAVLPRNVALIGARSLDPPEAEFIEASGIQVGEGAVERALEGADAVYIAFDADSLEPGELAVFMPEPGGLRLEEVEELLRDVASRLRIAGIGFSGLVRDDANEPKLARLAAAAGL